jgi:hypothetical protein
MNAWGKAVQLNTHGQPYTPEVSQLVIHAMRDKGIGQ